MSWLFGMNKNQPLPDAPQVPTLGGGEGGDEGGEGGVAPVGSAEDGYRYVITFFKK